MKLLSFTVQGRPSYGAVKDNGVVDLGVQLAAEGHTTLRQLLEANRLVDAAKLVASARPERRCSRALPAATLGICSRS